MIKTLTKHGDSYALIIDRAILDLLNLEPDTPLEISTDGTALIVQPARDAGRRQKLEAATELATAAAGATSHPSRSLTSSTPTTSPLVSASCFLLFFFFPFFLFFYFCFLLRFFLFLSFSFFFSCSCFSSFFFRFFFLFSLLSPVLRKKCFSRKLMH